MKGLLEIGEKGRTVVLIRHGETAMNEKDEVRGYTDVPLEEDQHDKLYQVGQSLKGKIDAIITCDLLRSLQTALEISKGSGTPIMRVTPLLRTWNVGGFTGMPTDTADPLLEKLAIEEPDKTIEEGESFNEFKTRYLLGLIAMLNEFEGTVAFVTHGRNLAALNAWANMDYNDDLELDPDCLSYEMYDPATAHRFDVDSDLLLKK